MKDLGGVSIFGTSEGSSEANSGIREFGISRKHIDNHMITASVGNDFQ